MENNIVRSMQLPPIKLQKYERYLPTAFDESMSILEKINKVILYLQEYDNVTEIMIEKWNEVYKWVSEEGIDNSVVERIKELISDGTIDKIISDSLETQLDMLGNELHELSMNINVFGGVGDGLKDETQTFKEILSRGNKNIYIPQGFSYVITDTLELDSNTTISGGGVIIDKTDNVPLFYGYNIENINLQVNVYGQGAKNNFVTGKETIYFHKSRDLNIQNSTFKDLDSRGVITLRECDGFTIKNNIIDQYSYSGVLLLDGCNYGNVDDNKVTNNNHTMLPNSYPITLSAYDGDSPSLVRQAQDITCANNYIDNQFAFWEGIDAHGGKSLKIVNNIIKNCMIGVSVIGAPNNIGVTDCLISGNSCLGVKNGNFREIANFGIMVSANGGSGNIVTNNYITGYGEYSLVDDIGGIKIQSSNDSIVSGNVITDCYRRGFFVGACDNVFITGNTVKNLIPKDNDIVAGVWVRNTATEGINNLIIKNNMFIDTNDYQNAYNAYGPSAVGGDAYILLKNNTSNFKNNYALRDTYILSEFSDYNPGNTATRVGIKDDIVYNSDPGIGKPIAWICTKSHIGDGLTTRAEWQMLGGANRVDTLPLIAESGSMVFYAQIGKPVWFNGIKWIDAQGTEIVI